FQHSAIVAQQQGNDSAARMAMTKVVQIEQLLPQLETRVGQAEQFVNASREKLERERMKLEAYKMDMENLKDMAEINEALATLAQVNSELGIDSARSQFEQAKNAIEHRTLKEQAYAELSENPAEQLEADLDRMTLDDEVSRRLRQLSESQE
ncbi:MAG: PspA/IM30 family protein, partial [Geitlerinemataceae cyanobacterium]